MYKRYYDGYGRIRKDCDNGEIIVPQAPEVITLPEESNSSSSGTNQEDISVTSAEVAIHNKGLSLPCELDDLILIGIIIFLLWDSENEDPLLLVIIAFLLLGDII